MSKKQYIKPDMTVVLMNTHQILLASGVAVSVKRGTEEIGNDLTYAGVDDDEIDDWGD